MKEFEKNIEEYSFLYNIASSESGGISALKLVILFALIFQIFATIFIFTSNKVYPNVGGLEYFAVGFTFLLVNVFYFLFGAGILFYRE